MCARTPSSSPSLRTAASTAIDSWRAWPAASRFSARSSIHFTGRPSCLLAAGQARQESIAVDAAVRNDGELLGVRAHMTLDAGWYQLSTLPPTIYGTIIRTLLPGAYRLRDYEFRSTVLATN